MPVLALLMIANTKVTAQEKVNPNPPVDADTYQIVMYEYDDSDRLPINDTVIYNVDGSYTEIKREREKDPKTGGLRTKVSLSTYDKKGKPMSGFHIKTEPNHGDTSVYHITPIEGFHFPAEVVDNDTVFQIVDEMPQYPGGEEALMKYAAENIKYPQEAKDKNIAGRVFVSFVVEKDGSVNEVKVMRGIGGGCDEEAVRVIKSMPKWQPGKMKGEPVRVSYMMPINFKLNDDQPAKTAKKSDIGKADMKPDKNGVYQIVEEMPRFPGEEKALMEYLNNHLKMPEKYKGDNAEYRLAEYRTFVQFVVNEDGSVSNVKLLKKTAGFEDLDGEAIRVVKSMPKWNPGKMDGKPVKVYFNLPVIFKFKK